MSKFDGNSIDQHLPPLDYPALGVTSPAIGSSESDDVHKYPSHELGSAGWQFEPRRMECSHLDIGWRLFLDLVVATLALLFLIFGAMVLANEETLAQPGTTGFTLVQISQYVRNLAVQTDTKLDIC